MTLKERGVRLSEFIVVLRQVFVIKVSFVCLLGSAKIRLCRIAAVSRYGHVFNGLSKRRSIHWILNSFHRAISHSTKQEAYTPTNSCCVPGFERLGVEYINHWYGRFIGPPKLVLHELLQTTAEVIGVCRTSKNFPLKCFVKNFHTSTHH